MPLIHLLSVCLSLFHPALFFFLLKFQKVNVSSDDQWPSTLADYIRHNDEALMKASERLLATYREELLPCSSFEEFCDVTGKRYLLSEMSILPEDLNELLM